MVLYYIFVDVVMMGYVIYVGRDKVENEDLIKYGFEYDVWFYVDKFLSVYVYLRMWLG